jgi:hypothetical protein
MARFPDQDSANPNYCTKVTAAKQEVHATRTSNGQNSNFGITNCTKCTNLTSTSRQNSETISLTLEIVETTRKMFLLYSRIGTKIAEML